MVTKIVKSPYQDLNIPSDVSLADYLLTRASKYGDKTAFIEPDTGRTTTFRDIVSSAERVSSGLWKRGVRKGDVVLTFLPNCMEYVVIAQAVLKLGAIVTTSNPNYTVDELGRQLLDSRAEFVFAEKEVKQIVQDAAKKYNTNLRHTFLLKALSIDDDDITSTTSYLTLTSDDGAMTPHTAIAPKSDVAMIPYSSGTSGLPKGVMLSHYNLITALKQLTHESCNLAIPQDVFISFVPFYHIFGIHLSLLLSLHCGYTTILMRQFDPAKYLQYIQQYKVTKIHVVPPVAVMLAKHPIVSKFDLSSVTELFVGAAPLKTELSKEVMTKFGKNFKLVQQAYGLTELSPIATINHHHDWKHGSAGKPAPCTEIKVVDIETGKALGPHKSGEVCVRGPQVMLGYLNNPTATCHTIDIEGWLHTGDIGYYDEDQHFYIIDRLKELIKYKGFQVAPAEMEALLLTHPAVSESAVIGIPDDSAGELPAAYIVLKPGVECTADDIHSFVQDKVTGYKKLRGGVHFTQNIPKTASGKILRRVIRDEVAKKTNSKL